MKKPARSTPGGAPTTASPGLSFIYAHLNRLIKHTDQDFIYITGPGYGGPAVVSASYLEGSYTECFPCITADADGMAKLFRQFSLPGGKIASPTVLSRKNPDEVQALLEGHGYEVIWVEGEDLPWMHERFANALTYAYDRIKAIQTEARSENWDGERPVWPMIILRTPKGWTGPHTVDHKIYEATWRSHQVPLDGMKEDEKQLRLLEQWLRSYCPGELFNPDGTLTPTWSGPTARQVSCACRPTRTPTAVC